MDTGIIKKNMLATVFTLAWPTVLEQFLTSIIQYIDTAMVGHISAEASATVGLSSSIGWLVGSPMSAAAVGALVIVSKAMGEGDLDSVKKAAHQAFLMALILAVAEGAVTLLCSPYFPAWMGAEESIRREASLYFAIICAPMLFRTMIVIFGMVIRATGDTKTPMKINLLMNAVNVGLNYFLINPSHTISLFGKCIKVPGAGWGVLGAGAATAISFVLGGSLMFAAFCRSSVLNFQLKKLRYDKIVMAKCVRIALPVGLTRVIGCIGQVVFTGMVSGMGTVTFAAHTVAITAESLFYIPGYGIQTAASTLSGYAWGRKDKKMFFDTVKITAIMVFLIMGAGGGILFAFSEQIMGIFSENEEVIALGARVLKIVALSEPLFGVSIVMEGLYNGAGKTRMPLIIDGMCMWGIRILCTFLCVKVFHLGLTAVWCCMIADNVCKALFFSIRMALPGVFTVEPAR